jgi:NAD(P)-dependent dehydrogenase (short-subunit alcohol dehydrogenase family)
MEVHNARRTRRRLAARPVYGGGMSFGMGERVAIVTGAGRGLGRSHALALAARGAAVVVNDTGAELDGSGGDATGADAVVAEIEAAGGRAIASYDDISTAAGAERVVETALAGYGRLDAVVNNAGILRDKTLRKLAYEDFEAVVQTHLSGAAHVTRAAWEALSASPAGRVVFTTSASGLYGQFGQANYGAAKAGLIGLLNVLKQEGARHGIAVNAIAPVAWTRMTAPLLDPSLESSLQPSAVTPVVVYLASAECTENGLVLEVGGGLVARVQVVESEALELGRTDEDVKQLVGELAQLEPGRPFATSAEALERVFAHAGATDNPLEHPVAVPPRGC